MLPNTTDLAPYSATPWQVTHHSQHRYKYRSTRVLGHPYRGHNIWSPLHGTTNCFPIGLFACNFRPKHHEIRAPVNALHRTGMGSYPRPLRFRSYDLPHPRLQKWFQRRMFPRPLPRLTLHREADLLGHANMQWTFVSPTLDIPNARPLIDINSLIKCALNFPTQTQTRPAA